MFKIKASWGVGDMCNQYAVIISSIAFCYFSDDIDDINNGYISSLNFTVKYYNSKFCIQIYESY